MKILKIIHTSGHGGAENSFRWLSWGLRRQGGEVTAAIPSVVNPEGENWIAPALEEVGVPYVTFETAGSPLQLLKNISALVDTVRPDLVHSHLLDSNVYSALVCRLKSIPHICTEHGDVVLKTSASTRRKYRLLARASRAIVCVSEAVRQKALPVVPASDKLSVIFNGIRFMNRRASTFRREFNISDTERVIGNVGNLYPVKGQAVLLRAFAELRVDFPQTRVVLVGRGGEEAALRALMSELNIPSDRVIFTGFRPDVENIMNAFDLYVQPSHSEGHPLAVLEAMSLGIPLIASEIGGIPEITRCETYAALVQPGAVDELQQRLRDFMMQPEGFRRKAASGQNFVRDEFSVEKMASRYSSCYRNILN